jgi:glyoxylate reductase
MAPKKPLVIVTRKLPASVETRLMELFDTRLNTTDTPMSTQQLIEAVKVADVLVPTLTDRIDREVLAQAGPNLKLLANYGAGVDHIDLKTARARGLLVTNTPGVLTSDTADLTMALILAVPRRMSEGERRLRKGEWHGWAPTELMGHRVFGKRLGIIGMGRIGSAVARRARAFGVSIHYHNRRRVDSDLESELEATYWDARRLALLKTTAYIVNTSRGEVIDEAALAKALEAQQIGGAGLDVYENEPTVNPALLVLENCVLLPHMSSSTHEARTEMGEKVIINIKTHVDGHKPPDRVLESMF